jgi:hypothetical protein
MTGVVPLAALLDPTDPFMTRKAAAAELKGAGFPASPRSLERWPVPTIILNGKAVGRRSDFRREAERRIALAAEALKIPGKAIETQPRRPRGAASPDPDAPPPI